MKKKFLTVISASCAVLALTSCGGNGGNTGKHPKITLYGTESLTLVQNGKELASASEISATFGKDFELTFKPNNQFAGIKRFTPYYAHKTEKESSIIPGTYELVWEELLPIEKNYSINQIANSAYATPYVGYGNYIYPNDYALARDYAYTYDVNTDGSATLKVKGEYFQKNLIISFDRAVTGDNDYCVPVQQLGLSDLLAIEMESWYDIKDADYITVSKVTTDGGISFSSTYCPIEYERDPLYELMGVPVPAVNDSLINDNASIKYSVNSAVPDYFINKIEFDVIGYKSVDAEGKPSEPVQLSLGEGITKNDFGDYWVNIPFINDGKNEAILEKTDDKTYTYGYKLKYLGGISITPKVTSTFDYDKGIEVNVKNDNGSKHVVDFGQASFIGRDYTTSIFSIYSQYGVSKDKDIKDIIPTINLSLGGGDPITFDYNDTDACTIDEWRVVQKDAESGEDVAYHMYSIVNKKVSGWQLTIRFIEGEGTKTKTDEGYFYYYLNPLSEDAMKKDGKYYNSIVANITMK